jgi:hypothetical protein
MTPLDEGGAMHRHPARDWAHPKISGGSKKMAPRTKSPGNTRALLPGTDRRARFSLASIYWPIVPGWSTIDGITMTQRAPLAGAVRDGQGREGQALRGRWRANRGVTIATALTDATV